MDREFEEETTVGLSLKVWLRLVKYFKGMKREIIRALIVILFATVGGAAYPLFIRYAVNNFIIPETT